MSQTEKKDETQKTQTVATPASGTKLEQLAELGKATETALLSFLTEHGAKKTPELSDYVASIAAIEGILGRLVTRAKSEGDKVHAAHRAKIADLKTQLDRAMVEAEGIEKTVASLNKSA